MASDDVREIKSRIDIVDVISEKVKLKKNGRTFWGCCPFHNEKTPSFSVSRERQTFHCFGCGKGGDIFSFIMEAEHLEFREALEKLAERAGVTLTARGASAEKKTTRDINKAALEFFTESFASPGGEPARNYMQRRGMDMSSCRRFEIGWAPSSWDQLAKRLAQRGFSAAAIAESGLVSSGRDGGSYDRFRGRVIFPIYNAASRLIGFGGRILDGEGAKYLNSPESALFNKRHNLYLLDKAKTAMAEKGCAILVEGYMDAIRAHLCGFTNTAASLGTALTQEQASLIRRMTGLCYLCYDADSAGQEAALRSMYILQAEGVTAKRVIWEGGKDPDEILQLPDGKKLFEKSIENALALPVFHAKLRAPALADPESSVEARNDLFDGLASLSAFDVTPCVSELASMLRLFPHEVDAMIAARRRQSAEPRENASFNTKEAGGPEDVEYMFCSLLWSRPELRSEFRAEELARLFSAPVVQSIIFALLNGEEPEAIENRWRQMGESAGMQALAKGNGLLAREGITEETVLLLSSTLKRNYLKRKVASLLSKIKDGSVTDGEYKEYLRYTRLLKGGNIKA